MFQLLFIGTTELMLIAGIALLLFGGKKLPEMMRGLGRGVQELKKGITEPIPENKEAGEDQNDEKEIIPSGDSSVEDNKK